MSTAVALPSLPALVHGTVSHARKGPVDHKFRHRVYQWLVDLDAMPRVPFWLRPFATFRASDHIGDPDATIRANIEAYCRTQGVDVSDCRILMLANARVLGHVFDPLSVFWAIDGEGVRCIVAEVHNTYGERHAYFLQPDAAGKARVDKAFYVSPFYEVDGSYDLLFELGHDRVTTTIVLKREGRTAFAATFDGAPRRASPGQVLRTVVTQPLMTQRTSALIRLHGVWLWLRRLPLVPRPHHDPQEGTS